MSGHGCKRSYKCVLCIPRRVSEEVPVSMLHKAKGGRSVLDEPNGNPMRGRERPKKNTKHNRPSVDLCAMVPCGYTNKTLGPVLLCRQRKRKTRKDGMENSPLGWHPHPRNKAIRPPTPPCTCPLTIRTGRNSCSNLALFSSRYFRLAALVSSRVCCCCSRKDASMPAISKSRSRRACWSSQCIRK